MPAPRRQSYQGINRSIRAQSQRLLTTGRRFERFDQIRQRHFWSSAYYAPDANGYILGNRQLFITPAGQVGQGFPVALTERETNWKSANRVPDNQNFECTELGVTVAVTVPSIDGSAPPDALVNPGLILHNYLQNCVVSITYLTNSVPLGMASDFAQASGPFGGTFATTDAGSAANVGRIGGNGFPAPALRRRFKIPILLQHGETFSFQFDLPRSVYIGTNFVINSRFDFFATESFVEKS